LVLKDRPKPSLKRPNDVLVKVSGVGICGTDLHILQAPPTHPAKGGAILGNELTGEVAEVGSEVKARKLSAANATSGHARGNMFENHH
jgi:threonine dehydrogenase-like Zn-dependent dehydrogenase